MRAIVLLMMILPVVCFAEMYGPDYEKCSQDTTIGIVDCLNKEAKHWDKRLNGSYKELMNRIEAGQQAPLKAAQRAWIKYRDANCAFYGSASGSLSQIEAAECLRAMVKERACELRLASQAEAPPDQECKPSQSASDTSRQGAALGVASPRPDKPAGQGGTSADRPAAVPPASMESSLHQREHTGRGSFFGMYSPSDKKKGSYQADFRAYVQFAEQVDTAGGSAVFGWMDASDEVVLLTHAKYLPSLSLAETKHEFVLRRPVMDLSALPRYLMICVWETEGEKVAPALAVYAERDDANHTRKSTKVLDSLIVNWVPVPAARAERKFAGFDYCAEISRMEQSHVAQLLGG